MVYVSDRLIEGNDLGREEEVERKSEHQTGRYDHFSSSRLQNSSGVLAEREQFANP